MKIKRVCHKLQLNKITMSLAYLSFPQLLGQGMGILMHVLR